MNVQAAEKQLDQAFAAAKSSTESRLSIELDLDRRRRNSAAGWRTGDPLETKLREAEAQEKAAALRLEEAAARFHAAQVEAGISTSRQAREERKLARSQGLTPDVEGAKLKLQKAEAALVVEQARHLAAKAAALAALDRAANATPDSLEARKAGSTHVDAQNQLAVTAGRLAIAQAAVDSARAALLDAEHHGRLLTFQEAVDRTVELEESFTAAAKDAAAGLGEHLGKLNAALLAASEALYRLPPELRDSRSAHSGTRFGLRFGPGGTTDVFAAASFAAKEG